MRKPIVDMSTPLVHLTMKSGNAKTGPMAVSTTGRDSCAPDCAFMNNGCYADQSHLRLHWNKVTAGERGVPWDEFCAQIYALPDGASWRHNQAGDLPHIDGVIERSKAYMLAGVNVGKRGFTYTHHRVDKGENLKTLWTMNEMGFTVNLSCNTLEEVDTLAYTRLPVVCVLPQDQTENLKTPEGRQVVVCPATVRDDVTCMTCMLCQQKDRTVAVGFPSHGSGKAKVEKIFWASRPKPRSALEQLTEEFA